MARLEQLTDISKDFAYFQEQWMCLSREDALIVTEKDWTPCFENVYAADGTTPLPGRIVEAVRVEFLGKKSALTGFGGRMREVPPDQVRFGTWSTKSPKCRMLRVRSASSS